MKKFINLKFIIVMTLTLLICLIGGTYAFASIDIFAPNKNVIVSGNVNIEVVESGDFLKEDLLPGEETTSSIYNVDIKNTGSVDIKLDLKLLQKNAELYIPKEQVIYKLEYITYPTANNPFDNPDYNPVFQVTSGNLGTVYNSNYVSPEGKTSLLQDSDGTNFNAYYSVLDNTILKKNETMRVQLNFTYDLSTTVEDVQNVTDEFAVKMLVDASNI